MGRDFAGGVLVLELDQLIVAADATLYYRDDLRRALRSAGVRSQGDSPSHLIAAAYQAWGPSLLDALEGDFAFVLWDRRRRQLLAARDFAGSRPLFFAQAGDRLVLGSSLTAVAGYPGVSRELNRLALAEDLIGSASMAVRETAFQAVERLPAGASLRWQPGSAPRIEQFWAPPVFERGEGPAFDEAAEQLRALLRAAVRERLAGDGVTGVWMSGGYDSPAVFALAHGVVRGPGQANVVPVSMSYPVGDPGREDELIEAVGRHLGRPIHWVPVADVPGLPDAWDWAGQRDEPFAHPYEQWNRALAAGSRAVGARVILGGNGGDQFFGISPVFLADLLKAGRWRQLLGEVRAIGFGRRDYRELFHWAFQPALPPAFLKLARRLRGGRPLKAHLQTPVPGWLGLDATTVEALWQRQWHYGVRRPDESFGSAETSWYLQAAFGQRIASSVSGFVQQAGVEARSPMYDRRVLEFMARRPREDRFARGETKRLLRRAMTGLLPAEHLAPRPTRTGRPSAYLHRVRLEALPRWFEAAGPSLRLAELGLAEPVAVRSALRRYLANPEWQGELGAQLFNLLATEFWIRAHAQPTISATALVA
jgi:asparagine synthase (glutamine-hydrolysing)